MQNKALTVDDVLWREPMCMLGWQFAATARRNGVKGVGRYVDYGKVFGLLKQRAQNGD